MGRKLSEPTIFVGPLMSVGEVLGLAKSIADNPPPNWEFTEEEFTNRCKEVKLGLL